MFWLLGVAVGGWTQSTFGLSIEQLDPEVPGPKLGTIINYRLSYPTSFEREQTLQNILSELHEAGYLAASADSLERDSNHLTAFIRLGHTYKWASLKRGNVEDYILQRTGFRDRLFYQKRLSLKQVNLLFERIVSYCEDHGYPFATIQLDSVAFDGHQLEASLKLEKSRIFRIDSIQIEGDSRLALQYVSSYLNIAEGDLYNEALLGRISTRIRELAFVQESRQHQVIFGEKYTKLILYLKRKKANDFNGVLGVLPDEETGEILLTGDVQLRLQNALSHGEVIDFNWRKLQSKTQDLKANFSYPFIFNTPLGLDAGLQIYRRDTLFTDLHRILGVRYLLSGGDYFKVYADFQSSSLISTKGLEETPVVPEILDVDVSTYGIGFRKERLDYRLNPRQGYRLLVNGGVGNKKIRRNDNLPAEMYDTLTLRSVQYEGVVDADFFLPIGGRSTFNTGFQGGFLSNRQVFRNELFRIGGLKTLRGFDEESINASSYGILTFEYRFLLEQNSYLYAFWDGAYYENRVSASSKNDTPFGFGAGISFQTRAGIFSVNYALGRQQNNPILIRAAKIHFGFVNFF